MHTVDQHTTLWTDVYDRTESYVAMRFRVIIYYGPEW
jgi:hypothetical protein